jgi:hypothetical protein
MTAFALVLILGAAAGWIASGGAPARARAYLRFTAVLYAAMAAGAFLKLAPAAVTDIVATLGSAVLCVAAFAAFRRSPPPFAASALLGLAALAGIAAAATGFAVLAAVPQVLSAAFLLLIARRELKQRRRAGVYLALSALSLVGAAACQLVPGMAARAGLMLFSAAGLIGVAVASDVLVEQRQKDKRGSAVRRAR